MARLASAAVLSLSALVNLSAWADDATHPRWQARLQLSSVDAGTDAKPHLGGSRILSANLLGDYYLTSSGFASHWLPPLKLRSSSETRSFDWATPLIVMTCPSCRSELM